VKDQPLDDPMGEASPLGRLHALDGKVLLLGVGHDRNTSLHLAEREAFGPRQKRVKAGSPIQRDGRRSWVEYDEPPACTDDFAAIGEAFEATEDRVGRSELGRLMRQRELVGFAAGWMAGQRLPDGRVRRAQA
jgi:aminoglycoside 3-N-acetyltransferase